tara:strand:+ start:5230 stop:5409 length:180 start_codon:yes stop_codon:yes gene_type:complete
MPIRVKFELEKEVKHSVRFKEIVEEGRAPVIGSIYVQKWYAGDAKTLSISIHKPGEADQ